MGVTKLVLVVLVKNNHFPKMKLNLKKLLIGCALGLSLNASAQPNTNFHLVSYYELTNFFHGFITNGFGSTNPIIVSSGLSAFTNTNGIFITTNGIPITIANGGSGTNSAAGLKTVAGGTIAVSNNAFFGDNNPTDVGIATGLPTANYPGQLLMTYGQNIGGIYGGQLFISGNDLSWRRGIQTGPITIFQYETNVLGAPVVNNPLNVRAGINSAVDNLIMMQNMDSNHYDAITWNDEINFERGAMGFGNAAVPFYKGINYLEDVADANGFYFVGNSNVMGGLEKTTGDFVWYQGHSSSSNNPFVGLTQIFRIQRSSGILFGNGAGLTGIVASATNGTASVDNASYFADVFNNNVTPTNALPVASFAGQMVMTYDSTIQGQQAGQLFFAGADKSWRRDLMLGRVSILGQTVGAGESLLVKTTNMNNVITIQNLSTNLFSAIDWLDSTNGVRGDIGFGNVGTTVYRGVNYADDNNTNSGFYFTSGGSLNGGAQATNGNFVWYTGTSTSSNSPYIGLNKSFEVDRNTGIVNAYGTFITGLARVATITAGGGTFSNNVVMSSNATINGSAIIAANLAFTTATTNLPSNTNNPVYYIKITNGGLAGSIPVYQ